MKGLFIKDLRLMLLQKHFFIIVAAITMGMLLFSDDVSFPLGFLPFVMSLFSLTTISYDEFDNGNAFLFTLPITRRSYVVEKYCFGFILGCGTLVFSTILVMITSYWKEAFVIADLVKIAVSLLPFMITIQAVMLPFQLKYGGEKGRIAMLATIAVLVMSGVVIRNIAEEVLHVNLMEWLNHLPVIDLQVMFFIANVAAILLFLISLKISIAIMNRKEF